MSLKYTSATVASATSNSIPVFTFLFAVLLHFEAIKLRTASGTAKLAGVALCIAGVLVIALYAGPPLNPLNHHRAFAAAMADGKQGDWMKGTFLMLLANLTWSLWIVLQARLLTEYPNKLLATTLQRPLANFDPPDVRGHDVGRAPFLHALHHAILKLPSQRREVVFHSMSLHCTAPHQGNRFILQQPTHN